MPLRNRAEADDSKGPGNLRLFCGVFEMSLGARVVEDPKLRLVSLRCLDDPNLIKPELHGYTSTQVSWCEIDDGLPRYVEDYGPDMTKLWREMEGLRRPEKRI